MKKNRILHVALATVLLLVGCAPRVSDLDRNPTAPPTVLNADREEVFTEAFRLAAIAPGIAGFEMDSKRGIFGNVTHRKICGDSGGWVIDQSDQGGGFISASSMSACEEYTVLLGNLYETSTMLYRISMAMAGTMVDRTEVVISYNNVRVLPAVNFIMEALISKFGEVSP